MDDLSFQTGAAGGADAIDAQRGRERDSLLLSAQLKVASLATPVTVRIRNLSAGGLMAEFAGQGDVGSKVDVEIRGIGWVSGRIAWRAEGRIGIALDREIDPLLARKPVAVSLRAVEPTRRAVI